MQTGSKQIATWLKPFHFVIAFWGEEFRQLFLELCLPSLLAEGNIPALSEPAAARFIIASTQADHLALAHEPLFRRLRELVDVIPIEIEQPGPGDDKFKVMTRCHKLAADIAIGQAAYGVFLCPDTVLSQNAVRHLEARARSGAKVVLVSALRHKQRDFIRALRQHPSWRKDEPLSLTSRELVALSLPHLHDQVAIRDFDSRNFCICPGFCVWFVPGEKGLILHNTRWAPLLFDYGSLGHHHSTSNYAGEGHLALDDDYVYRNYGLSPDIHVVTDSDDIAYVSVTPEETGRGEATTGLRLRKVSCLRVNAYSGIMDPLQWRLFRHHVRMHVDDINEIWIRREAEIDVVLETCLSRPPNAFDRVIARWGGTETFDLLRGVARKLAGRARQ